MVDSEGVDILESFLGLLMACRNLNRNEFFISTSSGVTGHIGELFQILVPSPPNRTSGLHQRTKFAVVQVQDRATMEQGMDLGVKIA